MSESKSPSLDPAATHATDELETSKEELQSVNEELITVISARKKAEVELLARREEVERQARVFNATLSTITDFAYLFDREGRFVFANQPLLDLWGLKLEEAVGKNFFDLQYEPHLAGRLQGQIEHVFTTGEVVRDETAYTNPEGKGGYYEYTFSPLRGADGEVQSVVGSTHIITERKQAELALRQSEERFRLLVEGAPDYAMFLLDTDANITYWSTGAHLVLGWTADEAIGQKASMIFTPEDLERGQDTKELETALTEGSAPDRRWHIRKDGTRLWLDGFMRRLDHEDGTLRGFAKVAREATEQKIAEEKLLEAHDELEHRVHDRTKELQAMNETLEQEMERRQRLESEILEVTERERARISQDLHDSLCQELTATAFLLKSRARSLGQTDPEVGAALTESAEMVNRNAGLARDLARGLHPLELGTGGLVAALRELAARTMQTVSCRCDCPRSLRIPNEQMAVNLYRIAQEAVINAVKHAKPSEVVICIERVEDEIHLVVTDDGTRPRRKTKGGLGTQMMQYRANVCGGTLDISWRKGKGTRVSCRVPIK